MTSVPSLSLEERSALEERLLAQFQIDPASPAPLASGPAPLSPAQQSIWIADQLASGRPLYNIPLAIRIGGPLNIPALERAWAAVTVRHAALRLRIHVVEQKPLQQPAVDSAPPFAVEDLAGRDLDQLILDEAQMPFNLTTHWLVRSRLIKISDSNSVWLLNFHHIIVDNLSLCVVFRDFSIAYAAAARGADPAFPPAPAAFLDLAARQSDTAEPPQISFPAPRRKNVDGDWRPISIPADIAEALQPFARREQTTLYAVLLAAFAALYSRQTGREAFTVGAPVSQRDVPGSEETVGLLVHTAPVYLSTEGDPSFLNLLARVKSELAACFSRAKAAAPFDVVFQLIDSPIDSLALPGAAVAESPTRTATSKFDLTFTLRNSRSGLDGNLEFHRDAFDAGAIDRWAARYVTLLRAVLADPRQPVSEIPLLGPDERRLVVEEWNRTETKYPRQSTIHQLFEEQVRHGPDAPALVFAGGAMSYSELDRRANVLADDLRRQGAAPGDAIAISLQRSPELIVGLLAVLKAGAAYVPVDPDYPVARREFMSADSGARLLIGPEGVSRLPNPAPIDPAAAYVIYTSGSTGQPKGVVVPHRAVVRLVKETNFAAFGPDEVFLQFAPISFDASTFEIWGALLNGARLAIFPPQFESLSQFGEVLRGFGVTTVWLTAGLFHQLVESDLDALRGVRQLLAGGDVLSPARVKSVLRALPGCRVINGYGPTENTTFSACYSFPADWDGDAAPIGRPISNSRCYILDLRLNPVGIGVPGELCVAGDGLALGYLNAPELTAQKFVRDPFSPDPHARLYRTGDLARFRADGVIEFLGRIDGQVKIRGFRVELGEVEEALRQHPSVAQAATVARQDASETRQLVAYIVPRSGESLDTSDVRRFLLERLPAHLIPSRLISLPGLPLDANGKVDRHRLPSGGDASPEPLTPPRNDTERAVAGLWRELLPVKEVGVDQNFFELGGHSLLAMRLQVRLFQVFNATVSLRDIFERPTIAALAAQVAVSNKSNSPPELIPRRKRRQ